MKKVLILCTGNSCRSIMAEALIKSHFPDIDVYSAGTNPTGKINPNAEKALKAKGYWRDGLFSKDISFMMDLNFDLVITVCDNAKENCPVFPKKTNVLHIGFEDPEGKELKEFETTIEKIERDLIPRVKKHISKDSTI